MSPVEEFAFLDPWHRVLPDRGVVAIAGSGGCTTTLLAMVQRWRDRGQSVLVSQTTPHPVPFALRDAIVSPDGAAIGARLGTDGLAVVVGEPEGERHAAVAPPALEELRRATKPDILVVQAQPSCGHLVRTVEAPPVWPESLGLAVLVTQVGAAGRLWTAATGRADESEPPRRVEISDLVTSLEPLLAGLPDGVRPLPFLTGLGAWRDLDGMFEIVQQFWSDSRVWVVALGELLGDERRDAADVRDLPAHVEDPFAGERVYAVYPAALDEE
jgi:hypothetical protein